VITSERVLLRMHLSNFARWHGAPLYEALVEKARREHLAGATVLAGFHGFVDRGPVLGTHPHALSVERPVVVEIVEQEDQVRRYLTVVEPMIAGHPVLVTLERAQVTR
jgi:uncharacterized protein